MDNRTMKATLRAIDRKVRREKMGPAEALVPWLGWVAALGVAGLSLTAGQDAWSDFREAPVASLLGAAFFAAVAYGVVAFTTERILEKLHGRR